MPLDMHLSPKDISDPPAKRKSAAAGLDGATSRPVKRRASKACQCCRARKVRCNVTEHGAPCTNCRLDEVECVVSESRRKKYVDHSTPIKASRKARLTCAFRKWNKDGAPPPQTQPRTQIGPSDAASTSKLSARKIVSRESMSDVGSIDQNHGNSPDGHVPHSICTCLSEHDLYSWVDADQSKISRAWEETYP